MAVALEACADLRTRICNLLLGSAPITSPGLSIGSTDTQLANAAFHYTVNGTPYKKAAVAAGTAFTATTHDIDANDWASFRVSIQADGTITLTVSASVDHTTEQAAINDLAATPADECSMGYITIRGATDVIWNATTDALAGGSSGAPARNTNYYDNDGNILGTL